MLEHTLLIEEFASIGVSDLALAYKTSYIHKHKEPGYSSSVNIGITEAKAKKYTHVVTINQDIELTHSILVPFIRAFLHAQIVGGRLLYPDGTIQSAGWFYRDDMMPLEYEKKQYFSHAELSKKERFVGGVTGALQGFSLECGYYDEGFSLSYEDVEFCLRNLQEGRKILYTPTIEAVHVESATRGYFVGPRELKSLERYKNIVKSLSSVAINAVFERYNSEYEQR